MIRRLWRKLHPESGDHLAEIILAQHPYLGWVRADVEIGGEAAAMGLVREKVWKDDEVSVNLNGSVARLQYFPNIGVEVDYRRPRI